MPLCPRMEQHVWVQFSGIIKAPSLILSACIPLTMTILAFLSSPLARLGLNLPCGGLPLDTFGSKWTLKVAISWIIGTTKIHRKAKAIVKNIKSLLDRFSSVKILIYGGKQTNQLTGFLRKTPHILFIYLGKIIA